MQDPHGLYWLGPLLVSMAWGLGVMATVGALVVGVVALVSPRAQRNRAKLLARRRYFVEQDRLKVAMLNLETEIGERLIPAFVRLAETHGTVGEKVRSMTSVLDAMELQGQLADADQPHVLVAAWTGGLGPASGPYEDLWQATAAAPVWEASLNDGADDERDNPVFVTVMPMYAPGT